MSLPICIVVEWCLEGFNEQDDGGKVEGGGKKGDYWRRVEENI